VSNIIEESIRDTQVIIREAEQWYTMLPEVEALNLIMDFPSCIRHGRPVKFHLLPGLARLCVIKAYQQTVEQTGDLNQYWYAAVNREAKESE
jgi:hypothetical protein